MEKILSIVETSFERQEGSWSSSYDGYIITTDKQVVRMGITNGQSCCESWGYLMSEDDVQSFVGSDLHSIQVVDEALNKKSIEDIEGSGTYLMFINIETSNGLLQFVAYNSHNGYYGHTAFVESSFVTEDASL
jgi:hypothetical protein